MPGIFFVLLLLIASCAKAQTVDEKMQPTPVIQAGIKFMQGTKRAYPADMEQLGKFVAHLRKNGYANDYYIMGMMHVDGMLPKDKVDYKTGGSYFEKAVEAYSCHVGALLLLGRMYADGLGDTEIDMYRGISFLEKASECGSAIAHSDLGLIYVTGQNGVKKDAERARKYFEKCAHLGDTEAMVALQHWDYYVNVWMK